LERKADLAKAYASEHLPRALAAGRAILAGDMTPILAKASILA
jgi:hypothetical protein